jgi:tetratricopeptide (TPR) repeat protein
VLARLPDEELQAMRERRAHQLVRWCERTARWADSLERTEVVARLAVEWEGLLHAVRIGVDPDREEPEAVELALRTCLALEPVLEARGPLFLGLELLDEVLKRTDAILGSDPLLQLRVLVARARALRRRGRGAAAHADLERAMAIAERWSDAEGFALCRVEQGRLAIDTGSSEDAIAILEPTVATCAERGDAVHRAKATALLGSASVALGRFEEGERQLSAAVAELDRLSLPRERARAHGWLATQFQRTGRFEESREHYRSSIAILRELGLRGAESRARSELGLVELHLDRRAEAGEVLHEAVALARFVGDRRAEAAAGRNLGLVALVQGSIDEARERFVEALAIDRDRGDRRSEAIDTGWVGVASHLGDHPDAAADSYRRALQRLEEIEDSGMRARFGAWYAGLQAERGDPSARATFESALLRHAQTTDPSIGDLLLQLRGALDLLEVQQAEAKGDPAAAARYRRSARERWDEAEARRGRLPFEARLAHDRLRRWVPA